MADPSLEGAEWVDVREWQHRILADAFALQRIAWVLLRQVGRGGPSNFVDVADRYLTTDDLVIFHRLVAVMGDVPGSRLSVPLPVHQHRGDDDK